MNWKRRVLQGIGFLLPVIVLLAVLNAVKPMLSPAFDSVPLWIHLSISGVSLIIVIGIVAWAVRGGIPPRSNHGRP